MSGQSCERTLDAGAYVLHSLEDDERAAYASHLSGCEACREAVAELDVVADALPMAASQMAPPPELKDRIMAVVESEAALLRAAGPEADRVTAPAPARRGRLAGVLDALRARPLAVAAAACALLALGVVLGASVSGGGDGSDVRTVAARAPGNAAVAVEVNDKGDAELVMRGMPSAPVGRVYQVWTMREGEDPQPTRTLFTVPDDGRARVAIDVPVGDVDQVLVTAEPAGGSQEPTRAPIVVADLA